jgi:hypothetical protein
MPIRKYRSVEEMQGPAPLPPLDPENLRIAFQLSRLAYELHPWELVPGVRKFRTLDEKNRHDRLRERRGVGLVQRSHPAGD